MPLAEVQVRLRAAGKVSSHRPDLVEDRFHQLPHVVSARTGDATVLMDRKRGTYFTLNEVGGRVWELVGAGSTNSEIVERLLEEYEVSPGQLEGDVEATIQQLLSDRLVVQGPKPSEPPVERKLTPVRTKANNCELRVPSVLWCGIVLAWIKLLLRMGGFATATEWIRGLVEGIRTSEKVSVDVVRRVEYAVALAGALFPGRARCLEQSLVLYFLLRRSGVSARFRIGAQPLPFVAHAWVEYRGEPMNDVAEHVKWFTPFRIATP